MEVTALLLLEPGAGLDGSGPLTACTGVQPPGFLPLLGRPLVHRLVEALALAGARRFSIVSSIPSMSSGQTAARNALQTAFRDRLEWHQSGEPEFWQVAEEQLAGALEPRNSAALIARVNAYFELGSASGLAACATLPFARLRDAAGDLDVFWATSKAKAQSIDLLRAHLRNETAPGLVVASYANPLRSAADLRRLTDDAFNLKLAFRPAGREGRPGIWAGEGSHIHRTARIVAPAYIGSHTKIRAAALVTRCSSIEQYCEVDCGTVVQASNILPFTYLGAGLELLNSVAGESHIANATKGTTTKITDAKLLNSLSRTPAVRLMGSTGRLAAFLPMQMIKGFFMSWNHDARKQKASPADAGQTAIATRLPASAETALGAGLAASRVTRKHGNE